MALEQKWKLGSFYVKSSLCDRHCVFSVWESVRQSGLEKVRTLADTALNSATIPVPNIQLNVTLHCTIYWGVCQLLSVFGETVRKYFPPFLAPAEAFCSVPALNKHGNY